MWGLWAFPLLVLLFVGGSVTALIWFFASGRSERPKITSAIALPLACVAIPIFGFIGLAIVGNLTQRSDTQLLEEVFGYRPIIMEDRMLFDDFGSGKDREIFMRAEPTSRERNRLMAIPSAKESEFTLDQFIARGASRGFMWWLSATDMGGTFCNSARILDAPGFRGWTEFRIAECLDAGTEFLPLPGKGMSS